jgi:hypothetical protein
MLIAYFAERIPSRVFVPLAATLAVAARVDAHPQSVAAFATDAIVLLLLVVQFRLWDDIADRRQDLVAHPQRVLVRAPSDLLFRAACVVLAAVNAATLALVYDNRTAFATFVALSGAMAAWYSCRGQRSTLGDHVLLLKYPAFVLIVAAGHQIVRPWLVVCSGAAVYLAACVYEAVHDPASPAAGNRILVACEACLLAAFGLGFGLWALGFGKNVMHSFVGELL